LSWIWMRKSYSKDEERNNTSRAEYPPKRPCFIIERSGNIDNKYAWLFLWIRFEDSLRLFIKIGIDYSKDVRQACLRSLRRKTMH